MLVLSRKESERIRLGNSIVVTVVRVSGDKVRLGIDAPPDVLVLREELEVHESADTAGLVVDLTTAEVSGSGQSESLGG
jgi:carbon storage regulator